MKQFWRRRNETTIKPRYMTFRTKDEKTKKVQKNSRNDHKSGAVAELDWYFEGANYNYYILYK